MLINTKSEIIIFGTSSFAKQMYYYFQTSSPYQVIGFALDSEYIKEKTFCDLPIITSEELVELTIIKKVKCFLALGYKNMRFRKLKFESLASKGVGFVSYISPYSVCHIDHEDIGKNSIILSNSTIEPFSHIGDNSFIWSGVTICHDVTIHDHCFIAANSTIGGHTSIGNNSFLGFSSTVSSEISVAKETLLAANSLLLNDSEESCFYVGSPATKKSQHKEEGIKIGN
jgi:UDP-N-acetylbacillosamine N-acetyltransferase